MLGRARRIQADVSASYAVVWANLRKRYPNLRTVVITASSSGDDASVAAVGLAEAAARLDNGSGLVLVLDAAMRDRRVPDSAAPSVRIIVALSPDQVRTILDEAREEFAFVIVVAPPPQQDPECIAIAIAADAVILVARAGRTRFEVARLAAELLQQAGVAMAASLLLTPRAFRRGRAPARVAASPGQIAELRPRVQLKERREAAAGVDGLT